MREKARVRVLLLGFSTRALAEAAAAAGYDLISIDYFADYDQQRLIPAYSLQRDLGLEYSAENLRQASQRFSWDAVVYTSNLENHPEVVAKLEEERMVLGNGPSELRVRNQRELWEALARAGILFPPSCWCPPGAIRGGERWLVKPEKSGGGLRIYFWQAGEPVPPRTYWQCFIPGTPVSAALVANGVECVVLGITEQFSGTETAGFLYRGNIVPFLPPEEEDGEALLAEVRRTAARLTCEFGLKGLNGLDFIYYQGKLYLLEVNPRYTASMELLTRAYGLDLFQLHVEACLNESLPQFHLEQYWHQPSFYGKRVVYARRGVQVPAGIEEVLYRKGVRDIPRGGERIPQGAPVCTVFATGGSRTECLEHLDLAAEWIYRQLEQ